MKSEYILGVRDFFIDISESFLCIVIIPKFPLSIFSETLSKQIMEQLNFQKN